jgi:hypothetical protein
VSLGERRAPGQPRRQRRGEPHLVSDLRDERAPGEYRRMEVRVATYMFATTRVGDSALPAGRARLSCRAQGLVVALRKRGSTTGSPTCTSPGSALAAPVSAPTPSRSRFPPGTRDAVHMVPRRDSR